ncbi:hypothetical protein PHLGIDRAFT_124304 [Phlebiopsis gigantea 11061_1 CR5-6]|uniref:NTF2 domain-containing protein n=1 Tax=Phlebiopsis gigantea (strain 11061_1 CR5-6) TaxID=745531 RepID=A0A0C3SDT2_PHLG1|nr:hypothetical protein PHLGIDRAFT_124304 [Phlebiopsis gigantea 11061_1 CR5-6]
MTNTTVNPSEVGWQFVPQYYTFVNKQPGRLHCFYTKTSTFIHGTEGEDDKPCYGQQEIHARITAIGFQDCKVFIHSVDAQSSANGGIIIQVIGEMSNKGQAWKKFVQTFFLAEQPNGYFVLNDIFRFLKEDAVEDEPSEETEPSASDALVVQEPSPAPASPAPLVPQPVAELEPAPEPIRTPTPPPVQAPEPEEPAVPTVSEPDTESQPDDEASPEPELAPSEPAASEAPETPAAPSPLPASPAPPPEPSAPSPAPPPSTTAAPPASAAAPIAPRPTAPPVRKTWANLAATGSNKWGSNVAQEAKGVSEAPVASSSPAPATVHTPAPRPQGQPPAFSPVSQVNTPQCFVKGVVDFVDDATLRTALGRFGTIKDLDIVRSKACAFFEYTTLDSARRAIAASLPPHQGGEGGIRIGDDPNAHRIFIDVRKERGERPTPRNAPVNGDRGRGGFRGRGGASRGRGGAQQK